MKRMVNISGTEETVTKPVINIISKDLIKVLNLKLEQTNVRYNGIPMLEEYYSGSPTVDKDLRQTIFDVNYKEEAVQDLELTRVPIHPDDKPFYQDKDTRTKTNIAYRTMKLNMELSIKSKSRSLINKIIDLLHIRKIDGGMHTNHNIQISFLLPNVVKKFIHEVYTHKNAYQPVTLADYVDQTFDKGRLDEYLSLSGNLNSTTLSIKEYQVDVLGYFLGEFTEVEKDKEGVYHILNLNYIVQYQKPIAVHMEFPFIVYNKKLSDIFVAPTENYVQRNFRGHEGALINLLDKYTNYGINKRGYHLKYPRYDDFDVTDRLYGYIPILSTLSIVAPDTPTDLFNINDLEIKFVDTIYEFILQERASATVYRDCVFYFALFENEDIKSSMLTLDELGNLTTNMPMTMNNTYRVVLYICNDLTTLSVHGVNAIRDYINKELDKLRDLEGIMKDFKFAAKDSSLNRDGLLFFDVYLSFFNVKGSYLNDIFKKYKNSTAGDILLKLKMPDYTWAKLSSVHHTSVYRLFKE